LALLARFFYNFVGAQWDCALPVLLSFVYPGHDASCPYL